MRKSGILLAVSSLPSRYGIGTLGKSAYDFVDFLKKAGQYYWQILPLSPVGYGNSPYQSFSAFAFNPYYIDLDMLCEDGLLTRNECDGFFWGNDPKRTDYAALWENRPKILRKAAARFNENDPDYEFFCEENSFWLQDYSIFSAIKERNGMINLKDFPEELKRRDGYALKKFTQESSAEISCHKITQFLFYRQWIKLKKYANHNGVHIIGDIPVYVSGDSSDVWGNPELFELDPDMSAKIMAGCPPDDFSKDGQLWGNPVYRWSEHEKYGYSWWLKRFRQAESLYDVTRIDHFRGLFSFYGIPSGSKTAVNGKWYRADGEKLLERVKALLPDIKIIAEDLGFITPEIRRRMALSGFPGMKILQFGFDTDGENEFLPHNLTKNNVVYTGTHDNQTVAGWAMTSPMSKVEFAMDYFDVNFIKNLPDAFVKGAMSSICDTAVIPMQDYLRQGNVSRMNTPSTVGDNWVYRIEYSDMNDNLANKIYRLTKLYSRL